MGPPATGSRRVGAPLLADGVDADEREIVIDGLRLMELRNVAYPDAHLAARARARGEPVASFDADFRCLGAETFPLSG